MAIALRSKNNLAYASQVSPVSVPAPASIVNNDILLMWYLIGDGGTTRTATAPAGWSDVPGVTWPIVQTTGGFTVKGYAWYKVAASESGAYSVTQSVTMSAAAYIAAYSGVDPVTPFTITPSSNVGIGSPTTGLGITTTIDASMIILLAADWAATANDLTPPTGSTPTFTEELDATVIYVADGILSPAGATGDKTMTNNAGPGGFLASLVALNPLGGGPTFPYLPNPVIGVSQAVQRAATI